MDMCWNITRLECKFKRKRHYNFNKTYWNITRLECKDGYLGTYLGFSEETLYKGGGFVNVKKLGLKYLLAWNKLPNYGEAPEDIIAIKKGIDLYHSMNPNNCSSVN